MSDIPRKENKMGVLPVRRLILGMAFPPMLSMLVGSLYNIVESIFVARISDHLLAAITLVFPIQMLLVSMGVGTGVGINSLIARRLGEKRQDDANSAAAHGFFVALINWVIFALFGLFFADDFLALFTSDRYILENGLIFYKIISVGSLFFFISVVIERILQATGNMLFPMIFNLVGGVINIVLSPILILGMFGVPRYGMQGAGMAVLISQFVVMIVALILLFGFKHHVQVKIRGLKISGSIFREIYSVGLPSVVMMSVGSVMSAALNAILIIHSEIAVAIMGIFFRINSFVFMPAFGLNQGALPVMAYNFGARNKTRLLEALKFTLMIAVGITLIGTAIMIIFSRQILMLFSATPEMLAIGIPAMRMFSITFVFAGFTIVVGTLFQALAHGIFSMIVSLMRQVIIVIPLAYILLNYVGITAAWASFPIAEFLAAILSLVFLRHIYKKDISKL
jgi:putative MATE family efflux protein